ncbi:MAG: GAF domain-containing protein [Acidobacteria bacterium]|nr:GAF domain-containing protein [Acidobacteriota bacterium]
MTDLRSSLRQVSILQQATEMILSSADVDTVLHQMLLIVRNYFGVSQGAMYLLEPSSQDFYCRAQVGHDRDARQLPRWRLGEGLVGRAAQSRAPAHVPDFTLETQAGANPATQSELAIPLLVRDEVIGVLDVQSAKAGHFTDELTALLTLFGGQAAVALENARLYSTERRRMRQIELLNLIARSATSAGELDPLLATLCDLVYDTFEGADACILLREADGSLTLRAYAGSSERLEADFSGSERSGIIAQAFASRANVVANDAATRKNWLPCMEGTGSELCAPLVALGETLGVVLVAHRQANFFTADDRAIAQAAADVGATAIKNVQLAEELRRLTHTDPLTGAYNQRHFHAAAAQEVARASRYGKEFALAMLDLRGFHHANAALGFERGDDILREVAQLLRSQLRSMDVLCRYAADRFALVLPETDAERMRTVLAKIGENLARIRVPAAHGMKPLTAAGVSVNYPQDGEAALELTRSLLARLEEAKRADASGK